MLIIGVDVGGTFTDIALTDTTKSETAIYKVPSSPEDPSVSVIEGVAAVCKRSGVRPAAISYIYHGTTVATNAVLEHDGARVGMLTTSGFRDIVHIGRHQRPQHYSIQQDIPWQSRPLADRRYRLTVDERIVPPNGDVLVALDEDGVRRAAADFERLGVEAVAVCFLFSYLNPEHEQRAKDILSDALPGVFITASHEVSPQFREFERFTTTCINAFVGPRVSNYLNRLERGLKEKGFLAHLRIMRSNGGVASVESLARMPVLTLLSGPAAGVLAGVWIGRQLDRQNLITLDIGGTSADIAVITDGGFEEASARDTQIAGFPVLAPMIDLHTIGAGGGSIAHIDEAGTFQVGPRSAGAVPGPAAYGRGGDQPTVTDANLVLGRLDAEGFLGGAISLDSEASHRSIHQLAERLGLDHSEAAEGILTLVNENMANAIRARTIQKGIDPREYALVAFGGAGPLHGAEVARRLGISEVILPPSPGIASAIGLLTTDLKYDTLRTAFLRSNEMDFERLNALIEEMEAGLTAGFRKEGFEPGSIALSRYADARYLGQGYELRVELPGDRIESAALEDIVARFHEIHNAEYGHAFPDLPVEFVNLKIEGTAPVSKIRPPKAPAGGSWDQARLKTDTAIFRCQDGKLDSRETPFYARIHLPIGEPMTGPAIILEEDSTIVVPPNCSAVVEPSGSIFIKIEQ